MNTPSSDGASNSAALAGSSADARVNSGTSRAVQPLRPAYSPTIALQAAAIWSVRFCASWVLFPIDGVVPYAEGTTRMSTVGLVARSAAMRAKPCSASAA